jgi:hypothetical protein
MMKTIALVTLLCFIPVFAIAAPQVNTAPSLGVFLNVSSAQKMVGDIKYYKDSTEKLTKKLELTNQNVDQANAEIGLLKKKDEQAQKDIQTSLKAKDEYKDLYVKTDTERLKCEESKPSRMAWFGWGALATMLLGAIVIGFATTRK